MSTVFGQSMPVEQQKQAEWLTRRRKCALCNNTYSEIDNLGQLQCHAYHPLPICDPTTHRYRCCGGDVFADGCVGADHVDANSSLIVATTKDEVTTPLTNDDVLLIAAIKSVDPKTVRTATWRQDAQAIWHVCRVDFEQRKRALNKNLLRQ